MRLSPAATALSKALGHVGDLRGKDGTLSMGSSSWAGGVVGEWKVELLRSGRSVELLSWETLCVRKG